MKGKERHDFLQELDQGGLDGWRELALGFVEAQMMTEVLRAGQSAGVIDGGPSKKGSPSSIFWLGGLAAALALGLFLGMEVAGKDSPGEVESGLVALASRDRSTGKTSVQSPYRNVVLARGVQPLERLKTALEMQGYDPRMRRGYVEATLADGRQLTVPVAQLEMSKKR